MKEFKQGDILRGTQKSGTKARHPIVYISGPSEAPKAIILTHSDQYSCNLKLKNIYDNKKDKIQYFTAHLIEKMAEWGPYHKIGEIKEEDLEIIQNSINNTTSMTWAEYERYTGGRRCPNHITKTA